MRMVSGMDGAISSAHSGFVIVLESFNICEITRVMALHIT
jgi:hypothetical protein